MIQAIRDCRPKPIASLALVVLLAGCAASPGGAGRAVPAQLTDSPRYVCPDGHSFTKQFDPDTHQTDLFLSGSRPRRLDPVPDPMGGALAQDADYQLRPGVTDASEVLTDRSTTQRQICIRSP